VTTSLITRVRRAVLSRFVKRWGPALLKQRLWDSEFQAGQWGYLDQTVDDPIYDILEKYLRDGEILDVGCGSGNTGNELDGSLYSRYTGTDISEVAIQQARARSEQNGRGEKNRYLRSDMESFVPDGKYDVILFRESIFYIPLPKVKSTLDHYVRFLKPEGVVVVRMCDREKYKGIVNILRVNYTVQETHDVENAKDVIIVFRR
jgi:2-polyprenyl-3-methyl-5-hydroxy-6-metoxy-1,4-benzoquinol methylase